MTDLSHDALPETIADDDRIQPVLDADALAAIEQRAVEATEGPWWARNRGVGWEIALGTPDDLDEFGRPARLLPEGMRTDIGRAEDAAFIAGARTDVPLLVGEVRAAWETVAATDAERDRLEVENSRLTAEVAAGDEAIRRLAEKCADLHERIAAAVEVASAARAAGGLDPAEVLKALGGKP